MSNFMEFLKDMISSPLSIISLTLPIIMTYMVSRLLFREKTAKGSGKDKLFKLFDSRFGKGLIKEREDLLLLINSISREFEREYSIAPILEDYLAYLTEREPKEKSESDILAKYYDLIKGIIRQENEEKPYANIPEEERRLLKSIEDSIKHNDPSAIQFNLQELNSVIATRNRIYQRADKINRWSIPIAILGIILTIIFGIMSLSPESSVDYKKIEQINKDLIQNHKVDSPNIK